MVAECYLGASKLLSQIEQLLATLPGAEKAVGLWLFLCLGLWALFVSVFLKACGDYMQGNMALVAELLQIGSVSLILYILHAHVNSFDGETRHMYLLPAGQEIE